MWTYLRHYVCPLKSSVGKWESNEALSRNRLRMIFSLELTSLPASGTLIQVCAYARLFQTIQINHRIPIDGALCGSGEFLAGNGITDIITQ
jgi:hypothetical protein